MSKDTVDHLEFERVHRIPTRRKADQTDASSSKPRPIIAKLSFFKDKGCIFQHVSQEHRFKPQDWRRGRFSKGNRRHEERVVSRVKES